MTARTENPTEPCGCSLIGERCDRHAAMMAEVHTAAFGGSATAADVLWSLQDGYGIAGYTPSQGWDWSGIRDSSVAAVEAMHAALHA